MSWLSKAVKKVNNFVAKVDPVTKNEPTFQSFKKGFEAGNWDKPFGDEASGWDFLGAAAPGQITHDNKTVGGALSPEKADDRKIGRIGGSIVADYFTFGLFSSVVKPGKPNMELESGDGFAFNSLTSPGALSSTQNFTSEPSSVTPMQAAQVANSASIKRWSWIAAGMFVLILLFKKGFVK